MKRILAILTCALLAGPVWAAPLGFAARTIIPSEVQQIISVDYRTMKNSPTALALKQRVLPDNLKQFEASIKSFGLDPDQDIDQLSFVSFRNKDQALMAVGIAEGQFPMLAVLKRSALGDAAQLDAYNNMKKRLLGSRYAMNFASGVNFDLDVITTDNFTASSLSSLVKAGVMYRKMSATGVEKVALDSLKVDSDSEKLQLHFKNDEQKVEALLHYELFTAVAK